MSGYRNTPIKLDFECAVCYSRFPVMKTFNHYSTPKIHTGHEKTLFCPTCNRHTIHKQVSEFRTMKPEVNMNELIRYDFKGQRVMTTKQVADCYEADTKQLSYNFNNQKSHYVENTHYFVIKYGEQGYREFQDNPNATQSIYLWTEKGCLLHAKSLGSDKAWQVYEMLVDTYFRVKELATPKSDAEIITLGYQKLMGLVEEMKPKAADYDRFISASNNQPIGIVAKSLNISTNGRKLGRNNMFATLREKGILMNNNVPKQNYIDAGYFEVKLKPITMGDKTLDMPQTFVTPKGISWLSKMFQA